MQLSQGLLNFTFQQECPTTSKSILEHKPRPRPGPFAHLMKEKRIYHKIMQTKQEVYMIKNILVGTNKTS